MGSARTSQLGFADETTPGLVVTPDLFIPVRTAEIIASDGQTESEAIWAGRLTLHEDASNGGNIEVAGPLELDLTNRSVGKILKHAIGPGAVNTTGSGPYTHTLSLGTTDGYALTVQEGIEDDAGTVQPLTSTGVKINELDIAWDVGEIVALSADAIGMRQEYGSTTLTGGATTNTSTAVTVASGAVANMVGATITGTGIPAGAHVVAVNSGMSLTISAAATADGTGLSLVVGKALATASFASSLKPYKAMHTSVTVAGSAVEVEGGSVNISRGIEARFKAGSVWSKEPKSPDGMVTITGEFTIDHNAAMYRRYQTGEKMAIVVAFSNGADSLTLTARGRITAAPTPTIAGRSRNQMTVGWKAMGTTDNNAFQAVLVNADSTI
jgi:hypothetical protein